MAKEFLLPEDVKTILDRLFSAGYRADVVGGSVRDHLLSGAPNDFDITTAATPEETEAVFSDLRVVETGKQHGTVTVVYHDEPYEITTYRVDGEYADNRHPVSVSFTRNLTDDLARRDFTVNAIAYNPKDGYTDPFGGMRDLSLGILRAVGDPERRFSEDALRILRAVRFSAVLGFSVEPATRAALFARRASLSAISAERIYIEWRKLLSGKHAYSVLAEYREVLAVVLPELSEMRLPDPVRFERADFLTREIALFALNSDAQGFDAAMRRLHTDTYSRVAGCAALSDLSLPAPTDARALHILLASLGLERTRVLLPVLVLLGRCGEEMPALLEKLLAGNIPYRVADLAIGGREVLASGARGARVGEILAALLSEVAAGRIENRREPLLSEVAKILDNA